MSAQTSKHIVLIGLPATGKTSFLAALWYLVQHSQVPSALRLYKSDGRSKYLHQSPRHGRDMNRFLHTRIDSKTPVSSATKDAQTGQTLTLSFPDLSGESFTLQWTSQFTQGYDNFLRQASGGILFISPLKYAKPIRIDMANPLCGRNRRRPARGRETRQTPYPHRSHGTRSARRPRCSSWSCAQFISWTRLLQAAVPAGSHCFSLGQAASAQESPHRIGWRMNSHCFTSSWTATISFSRARSTE